MTGVGIFVLLGIRLVRGQDVHVADRLVDGAFAGPAGGEHDSVPAETSIVSPRSDR